MSRNKQKHNYQLQLGNTLLTVGYNFISITDMPHKLSEFVYRSGSVEYGLLTHLLSPNIKDETGSEREKTKEEISDSRESIRYLACLLHSTELFFSNKTILDGYSKLVNDLINNQKLKEETDTTAIEEMSGFN